VVCLELKEDAGRIVQAMPNDIARINRATITLSDGKKIPRWRKTEPFFPVNILNVKTTVVWLYKW
jgi:hypothetical protein